MNLENSLLGQEGKIAFETQERSVEEKERVLSDYCSQKNNPIIFVRQGEEKKDDVELAKDWQQVEEVSRDVLEEILKQAEIFLRSPVFTDSFHENHSIIGGRRAWEGDHIDKGLDADIADYYKTNRFNISRLLLPFNFKSIFEMIETNSDLGDKLRDEAKIIIEKLNSGFPDNLHEYPKLSDEKKLEIVEKIEPIFQEIVKLLSDQ